MFENWKNRKQKKIEQKKWETNDRVICKVLPITDDILYVFHMGLLGNPAGEPKYDNDLWVPFFSTNSPKIQRAINLQEAMTELIAQDIHSKGKTLQEVPLNLVIDGLISYYAHKLPNLGDLSQVLTRGLETYDKFDKVFTEEQVDNWVKIWQETRPKYMTLLFACRRYNYNKTEGRFEPEASDEKECANVEKALRETFEDLLGKDINKKVEELRQEEEKAHQKEAYEHDAKAREEKTEKINAKFDIGKEK